MLINTGHGVSMSTIVFDPLYIKMVEREIGRKLDDFEFEAIKYGEPVYFQRKDGSWASYLVPHYKLQSLASEGEAEASFFDYAFDGGALKKVNRG